MNDNIRFFLSRIDISPVDYVWMDLSDYIFTQEYWQAVVSKVGAINSMPVEDYPLPFDRMAVVNYTINELAYEDNNNPALTLTTIERVERKLLYTFHLYIGSSKAPAVKGMIDGDASTGQIVLEKQYVAYAKMNGVSKDRLEKLHKSFFAHIIRKLISLSVKPDPTVPVCRPYGDIAKNAKRRKKGKTQFWEWKTIELKTVATLPSVPNGGTHASPKPHERIGHWRQYKSGKRVFIKAHIVNKHKIPSDGFVFHDYVKN